MLARCSGESPHASLRLTWTARLRDAEDVQFFDGPSHRHEEKTGSLFRLRFSLVFCSQHDDSRELMSFGPPYGQQLHDFVAPKIFRDPLELVGSCCAEGDARDVLLEEQNVGLVQVPIVEDEQRGQHGSSKVKACYFLVQLLHPTERREPRRRSLRCGFLAHLQNRAFEVVLREIIGICGLV